MNQRSIFEQIDETVMAYPRGRGLHMNLRDPITYLPSAQLMEQKLQEAIQAAIASAAELAREHTAIMPAWGTLMKFKVDQNLPIEVAQLLREAGTMFIRSMNKARWEPKIKSLLRYANQKIVPW